MADLDWWALAPYVVGTLLLLGGYWRYLEWRDRQHRRRCVAMFDAHIAALRAQWPGLDEAMRKQEADRG